MFHFHVKSSEIHILIIIMLKFPFSTSFFHSNLPELQIMENTSVGTTIVSDVRTYLGLPVNSIVKLGPGALNQFVQLDNRTARLYTINSIDLESNLICDVEKLCCRSESTYLRPTIDNMEHYQITEDKDHCKLMAYIFGQNGF